jgi:peptidyl-prolyl cis-trans isomerase D
MLRNFRQVFKGNQTPMAVIMMIVLLGMVAYLAPSHGSMEAPDNVVARVYGRDILKRDVDIAMSEQIRRMGKQANLEAMLPFLQSQVLNRLVEGKAAEELAERHGIVVTDTEVRTGLEARLRGYSAFVNSDGSLRNSEEINATLRENGQSLKQWENDTRVGLGTRKLVLESAARVPVDDQWVNLEQRIRNEKISFEAATATVEPGSIQDPGTPRLEAFLKESGARFQAGPRRVVQFVSLEPSFFGADLADDAAVKAAYEAKKGQYSEMKASHILFKAETEAQVAEATAKAQAIRAKLVAGQDFAKAAEELSQDPSAKGNKGDLGWFKSGAMVKPFEDAAAGLKIGELSQPVRTNFGIHIIKLEGRRQKTFEEVKDELKAQVGRERFASKAKDKLEQLRKRAGDRGDLNAPGRNLGLKVETSKPFEDSASAIEGLPGSQSLVAEAFRMEVGLVSKTRQVQDRYVVIRVQEERPSSVPPLADIRARVLDAWKLDEARRVAMDKVKAALQGGDLKAVGPVTSQDNVTLAALAELGKHPAIRKALLDTAVGQLTPALWSPEGKVWVARIKARTPAEALTFESRKTLVEAIQSEAAGKLLNAELRAMITEGRLRPGFSSLWGRLSGIWVNKQALEKNGADMQDLGADLE